MARNFCRRSLTISAGFLPSSPASMAWMVSPTALIASSGARCAPPSGSGMISSMIPSYFRSCAVSFSATAASRIFSASFHRIEAQPSGEITE